MGALGGWPPRKRAIRRPSGASFAGPTIPDGRYFGPEHCRSQACVGSSTSCNATSKSSRKDTFKPSIFNLTGTTDFLLHGAS
jgi:hypothetical protein